MRRFPGLLILLPAVLLGGTITESFQFAPRDFVFDKVNGYDVVALPGQYWTSEPGRPNLPLAVYNVLIPPDAEVTSVGVTGIVSEALPGEFDIHPTQRPYVLSQAQPAFVEPDRVTYSSDSPYPTQVATFTASGCMGGFRIAGLQIAPLQYVPAQKQLRVITRLNLAVHYVEKQHQVVRLDQSQIDLMAEHVRTMVRNPEQIAVWHPEARVSDDWLCDMLVITNSALAASFQPFADWKTREGFKTIIVQTESIYAAYAGRDNQEKIRNCVIDYWQNHGLKWLLLGGDDQVVPVRLARQTVEGNVGDIATDLYYADLQYSWDSNHNNLFGEMDDSVDLYYDVFAGRWTADNASDVAMFFAKDTMYERHPDSSYIKKVLFGSIMLFPPFHGKVINHIMADLFPSSWAFDHLEDPGSGVYASAMDDGYQLAHVAAHGNQSTFSVMDASEAPGLTNGFRKLNFVNSIACESGWFDDGECLAEALVMAPNGGCIACMLNSRFGFGYPPGFGPSEMIDEQFYIDFLSHGATRFGTLCASCKDHFQSLTMNQEVWRWCVYELNLFGDPTLSLWSQPPAQLVVNHGSSIPTGPQTFRVTALNGSVPVPGALICASKGSETYACGLTNSQGWIDLLVNPTTTGALSVTASAQDFYPHESQVTVTGSNSQPALVFSSLRIDDPNHNGRLDPGETADLYVSLQNAGSADATSVTAKLRTSCPGLVISDSVASYGTIVHGAVVEGDRFQVTASDSVPDGTIAEMLEPATASQGNWTPFFTIQVGPDRTPRKLWADHDIGNMILSMTSVGSVGTLGPYREGSGMKYPRTAGYGSMYFTSFACSNGPNYVVDRWYGNPSSGWNTDWHILDTLHAVVPPIAAQQEYQTAYDDAAHATPKGLTVTQWSGCDSISAYRDFVVVVYNLENRGASALNNLYAGIMSDFDVYNTTTNDVATDNPRRLAWMTDNSSTWVGVKLLSPGTAANVSGLDNSVYVDPTGMMTEAVKDSFLRGAIHLASGSSNNYSCVVSAGPFNLSPGARTRVAFAFVGGASQTELQVHADSSQSWYDHQMPVGLTYLRSTIDDASPGGNGDGILNPGENINLPLWVVNRADFPASGVWGILRKTSGDTLLTITDSIRHIGPVGAGDSAYTGADGFKLRVAQACTNGYVLPMVLVCRDTLDSNSVSLPGIRVGAAQLVPGGILCWDPQPGGNGNGRLDPGEQDEIAVGVQNIGLGNAVNVSARLKSGDARFVILDSLGTYGMVSHDSTIFNSADRFLVRAAGTIPPETQIPCTLFITGDGYQAVRAFSIGVGVLTALDPIPDGPRTPALYYGYDDVDTFYVEHPVYNWIECRGRGTQLSLGDDQTEQVPLPAQFGTFRYYGQDYSQIAICSNGFIAFGSYSDAPWSNATLPTTDLAGPAVCANWDDLYPPVGNGVWYFHDTTNHAFVIEWDSVAYYSPQSQWDKFEILLQDSLNRSPNGENRIVVQYKTANNYVSNTAGIQDPTQAIGINALFNGAYHRAASQIVAGRAIRYCADSVMTGVAEDPALANRLRLSLRVAPNPFRSAASISYSLPVGGSMTLKLYDVTGKLVRVLASGFSRAGRFSARIESKRLARGIYLLRLATGGGTMTRKLVIE